jgi:hypothetical protein
MYSRNKEHDSISITVSHEAMTQTFASSRRLLKGLSGYFETALSGRWEANNNGRCVKLEDDPRMFDMFLRYAHSARLQATIPSLANMYSAMKEECETRPVRLLNEEEEEAMDEGNEEEEGDDQETAFMTQKTMQADDQLSFSIIVSLYIFADRRDIPRLAALAITLLVPKIHYTNYLPVSALRPLLHGTALGKESNMFRHLVFIAARYVSDEEFDDYADELPDEFLVKVIREQSVLAEQKKREQGDRFEWDNEA